MDRKRKNFIKRTVRIIIQIAFFFIAPGLFQSGFAAVRHITNSVSTGTHIEISGFFIQLIVLTVSVILVGRLFCGYACSFGFLGDVIYGASKFVQKKFRKKVYTPSIKLRRRLLYVKYAVLAGIVLLVYFGLYQNVEKYDPWEGFANLRALNFSFSTYPYSLAVFGLILVVMAVFERGFCIFLCPLGAYFALLPTLPFLNLKKQESKCIKGCNLCERRCPASIDLNNEFETGQECIKCFECTKGCPVTNIHLAINPDQKNNL